MGKIIYLPNSAQKQLETSDNSSVWAKPIRYSEYPGPVFSLKLELNKSDMEYSPIDEDIGYFYPDRTEPDSILERLEQIKIKTPEKKLLQKTTTIKAVAQSASKEYLNAVYRCFENVDAECWARYHDNKIEIFSNHVYHFTGFGHVSLFHMCQEKCLDMVLEQGAGLYLNRKEVKMCDGSLKNYDEFPRKDPRFAFTDSDTVSLDGATYKLFQDHDEGARGWALFAFKYKKKITFLMGDHCGNIRDEMLANDLGFLKDLGFKVNFKYLNRANHDFYKKPYVPKLEDFLEDFHVDKNGKRKKA